MTGTRSTATARFGGLLRLLVLFCVSFAAACGWLFLDGRLRVPFAASAQRDSRAPPAAMERSTRTATIYPAPDPQAREPGSGVTATQPLPAAELAALIDAGINAEDSEQRSLAILELAGAPVDQSLGALATILRENRDRRSRLTALEALLRLPELPQVRDQRRHLLDLLARDPDAGIAEAARAVAVASG
jgi:hypothetical protein